MFVLLFACAGFFFWGKVLNDALTGTWINWLATPTNPYTTSSCSQLNFSSTMWTKYWTNLHCKCLNKYFYAPSLLSFSFSLSLSIPFSMPLPYSYPFECCAICKRSEFKSTEQEQRRQCRGKGISWTHCAWQCAHWRPLSKPEGLSSSFPYLFFSSFTFSSSSVSASPPTLC